MTRLDGKVALVTGGASGIGRAVVERFAADGAYVVVGDIDEKGLASLASKRVAASRCDVTSEADQAALVRLALEVTALELGEAGIRVNAVAPGLVKTQLTDPLWLMPGLVDQHLDNTPLGRWTEPHEIAAAVAFLVSDEASFITGTLQLIDGGSHLDRYPDIFAAIPGESGLSQECTR